jgi:hypothetical protein
VFSRLKYREVYLRSIRLNLLFAIIGSLLLAAVAVAEDDWGADLEIYGWLPIIEMESEEGSTGKFTRDDILSDLDVAAMAAARLRKGRWSLASDLVYLDLSSKTDLPLVQNLPGLLSVKEAGLQAWIVTPNIGYAILQNDKQKVELYAGARYFWIEVEATVEIDSSLPGRPPRNVKESPTKSNWDGIVGVRGLYDLSDSWRFLYSVNGGAGDSDLTWGAKAAFGYKYSSLDAVFGWRYLYYDIGSDTLLKKLEVNGPFVGAIFRW